MSDNYTLYEIAFRNALNTFIVAPETDPYVDADRLAETIALDLLSQCREIKAEQPDAQSQAARDSGERLLPWIPP